MSAPLQLVHFEASSKKAIASPQIKSPLRIAPRGLDQTSFDDAILPMFCPKCQTFNRSVMRSLTDEGSNPAIEPLIRIILGHRGLIRQTKNWRWNSIVRHWLAIDETLRSSRTRHRLVQNVRSRIHICRDARSSNEAST